MQFIIATHAEALIDKTEPNEIISILGQSPRRIPDKKPIVDAMSIISNTDATQAMAKKIILYVEGEDDERILGAWEKALSFDILRKVHICFMRGGSKKEMIASSDEHFRAIREIEKDAKRVILLDRDDKPIENNQAIYEWKRKKYRKLYVNTVSMDKSASQSWRRI